MNWNRVSLEKLESLAAALVDYLALRRQQAAASQVEALAQERRQVSLELSEARAELSAQRELSARLMAALKIGGNGAAEPTANGVANRPSQLVFPSEPTATELEDRLGKPGRPSQLVVPAEPTATGLEDRPGRAIAIEPTFTGLEDLSFPEPEPHPGGADFDLNDLDLDPAGPVIALALDLPEADQVSRMW